MAKEKKPYLVTAEFCAKVDIYPEDLEHENYGDLIKQFVKALESKINNDEILENITNIEEDNYD